MFGVGDTPYFQTLTVTNDSTTMGSESIRTLGVLKVGKMETLHRSNFTKRYHIVTEEKSGGATYTPKALANFVAQQIVDTAGTLATSRPLRILDPAIGHGELLISLLEYLSRRPAITVELYGFETNSRALGIATKRLRQEFSNVPIHFEPNNFLDFVLERFADNGGGGLFHRDAIEAYDLIIANPPYVRTQILGAKQTRILANRFGLSGRVDLYYAFILAMSRVLKPQGIAGIIVSNRFMTTKSGASVRSALSDRFTIHHAWDLGDTKLFDAAVLPAVLLLGGKKGHKPKIPAFTSIYQTTASATQTAADPIAALNGEGVIEIADGRRFMVRNGKLNTNGIPDGVWRVATDAVDTWLATVEANSWGTFRDIGKIRVGVKTCADKVFLRTDWQDLPVTDRPELLKPLTTHHIARRFKPLTLGRPRQILYPHEIVQGRRRAVDLACHPRSASYLEKHRPALESRRYVIAAGRKWYEIWVPQDPDAWSLPKLVFRDIAKNPIFWIDLEGSVINGDCYWLIAQNPVQTDLLWLAAAVGNSTFIEQFYDLRFHNKLYAGRRRFITQYVENFPLPNPYSSLGKIMIETAKQIYCGIPSLATKQLQIELDSMVWEAFAAKKFSQR